MHIDDHKTLLNQLQPLQIAPGWFQSYQSGHIVCQTDEVKHRRCSRSTSASSTGRAWDRCSSSTHCFHQRHFNQLPLHLSFFSRYKFCFYTSPLVEPPQRHHNALIVFRAKKMAERKSEKKCAVLRVANR